MAGPQPVSAPAAAAESTPRLADARRVIVKIGSALLVDDATGAVRRDWLDRLADDLAALRARGQEVVIVTSGAISIGRRHLGLTGRRIRLEQKQAAAATGQIRLAHAYSETFARHGITVAQILLTPEDTEARRRHLNARATLETLLGLGAIPVVNENDSVATAEIRFGDNDRLAARVAQMISADTLVLLSDIDGLYTADPKRDPAARHIPVVPVLTPEIEAMAGDALPGYSSGGMVTKLAAARIAVGAGCRMVIAQGARANPIAAIEAGRPCTWFLAGGGPKAARKRWIAGSVKPKGCWWSMPAPRAPSWPGAACCPRASSPSRAGSSAATRSSSAAPRAATSAADFPRTTAAMPCASAATTATRSPASSAIGAARR